MATSHWFPVQVEIYPLGSIVTSAPSAPSVGSVGGCGHSPEEVDDGIARQLRTRRPP
jgi:hypothetical protein